MNNRTLLLISLILYLVFFLPLIDWNIKTQAIAALIIIQMMWIGRVFPLAHSSLLFMLLLSFHFFTYEETLAYFSSEVVWLLFATFIISRAFIETGLASRISLTVLKVSGGSGRALLLISFLLMLVLAILIPSNVGKGNLVASVLDRLLKNVRKINKIENLGKALFIGISYLTAISGALVATGASSTIYTFELFTSVHADLNYITWILYFVPPVLLFTTLLWVLFIFKLPPEKIDRKKMVKLIEEGLDELGLLSLAEKKVMFIMGLTLLLWITQSLHGFSIPLVGLLGAVLTVTPWIGVWKWDQAKDSVNWDMMLFFASTLMVSGMLIKTGTIASIADSFISLISFQSPFLVILLLIVCTAILRIIFVNILGFLTIMIPLAIEIGETLGGYPPFLTAMVVFLVGIPGFFLITQSPVHLISHSFGYFSERELLSIGLPSFSLWVLTILGAVIIYWPYVLNY
ncbi:citrate:succinate antiporter [Sediminibacillus dalangtanensis]|uniref:Sodium-dependent dicarboxylate transporter SdcS n=1 Tax=Sediminibacillus dalangtanensis TaxID=2729421 RepID=A0ABX7VUI8_9BACI|nr:SLC13 family permease [Sediminibacillus dalangtanensis]QTN00638.1 citrate:succinate antiporter [Sediminibacillus dalangtanensis]